MAESSGGWSRLLRPEGLLARLLRALKAVLGWTLLIGTTTLGFGIVITSWAPALTASRGNGLPGTYLADRITCDRDKHGPFCYWTGTFVSDDGTVRFENLDQPEAPLDGRPPQAQRLLWTGGYDPVDLVPPGRHQGALIAMIVLTPVTLGLLITGVVAASFAVRRRPYPEWIEVMQDLVRCN